VAIENAAHRIGQRAQDFGDELLGRAPARARCIHQGVEQSRVPLDLLRRQVSHAAVAVQRRRQVELFRTRDGPPRQLGSFG